MLDSQTLQQDHTKKRQVNFVGKTHEGGESMNPTNCESLTGNHASRFIIICSSQKLKLSIRMEIKVIEDIYHIIMMIIGIG